MRGSEFAELQAFATVAHRASFVRAAEHLHVAPSTLSQTVRALEDRLGVTLLNRTTRRVSLTSTGAQLLARFAPALEEMQAALAEAHNGQVRPRGRVRLHAPRPAYSRHVEPALGLLREALPEVTLDLCVDEAPVDTVASRYDLFICRAEFVDCDMVVLDLGADLRHAVVASPAYLGIHGTPLSPLELTEHRCIQWHPAGKQIERWHFIVGDELLMTSVAGPLIVSHCDAAVAAALQGVGIAYVLDSYAMPLIADGRLVRLLSEFLQSFGGWKICHPRQVRLSAAASAVADFLAEPREFGDERTCE